MKSNQSLMDKNNGDREKTLRELELKIRESIEENERLKIRYGSSLLFFLLVLMNTIVSLLISKQRQIY
jgi:hypothetical protein